MSSFTSGKISHDPEPYRNRYDGSHWADDGGDPYLLPYAPRPEFDNHNPILVAFRRNLAAGADYPDAESEFDAANNDAWMAAGCPQFGPGLIEWCDYETHAYRIIDRLDARRVLTKLAHLTETETA